MTELDRVFARGQGGVDLSRNRSSSAQAASNLLVALFLLLAEVFVKGMLRRFDEIESLLGNLESSRNMDSHAA